MTADAPPPRPRTRRILFIHRAFQLRFIAKVTLVVVLGTALTGGLLFLLANQEFGRAFYSAHYQARSSWELLLPSVVVASFVSMGLVAVVAVVLTLYDSHRIGGPLYRFQTNLKQIGLGDLTLVTRLRDRDELTPMSEALNEMTRNLRERVQRVRDAEGEVRAALEEIRDGAGVSEEQARAVERVMEAADRLQAALGAFRVEG